MKTGGSASDFALAGIPERNWFSHYVVTVAKPYPDSLLALERRNAPPFAGDAPRFRQINVYTNELDGLSDALFEDRSVNWHRQQFGLKGHIASAGLCLLDDDDVLISWFQSDLCQQLFRHPELRALHRTQVDSRFGRWYQLLLNAVLDFGLERGFKNLYVPTGATVLNLTRKRIQPQLFSRIYDDGARRLNCSRCVLGGAEYWRIRIADNVDRIVPLRPGEPARSSLPKGICVFHDIEQDMDTEVSKEDCRRWLLDMLHIEQEAQVQVTYSVLGSLYKELLPHLAAHNVSSLAFHSYDHRTDNTPQLPRVRKVDLQVRGYRPPQSVLTPEVTDGALSFYNFEWLLSSVASLGFSHARLENGIVKIPVHIDDYSLQTGRLSFEQWCSALWRLRDELPLVVVGLHDCYARHWIGSYDALLTRLRQTDELLTCDQVADAVFLASDGVS